MIVSADRYERKHLFHSQRSAGGKPAEKQCAKTNAARKFRAAQASELTNFNED
jgi:hypothetical protein